MDRIEKEVTVGGEIKSLICGKNYVPEIESNNPMDKMEDIIRIEIIEPSSNVKHITKLELYGPLVNQLKEYFRNAV
jgi:hypothetical protein